MSFAPKPHSHDDIFAVAFVCVCLAACSSSSSPVKDSADGGNVDASSAKDCSTITSQRPFDDAHACFADPPVDLTGVCREQAAGTPTTGLEPVCAVHAGELFILVVGTDQILSGEGWTFGPRAAPDVVKQSSSLSAADESRCNDAEATPLNRVCDSDAGRDADTSD